MNYYSFEIKRYALCMTSSRNFLRIALSLFFAGLISTDTASGDQLSISPEIANFGTVAKGDPIEVRFVLKNHGESSLTVQFMEFSDPGLLARISPVINPGHAVEAVVYWKTAKLSGNVTGSVILSFAEDAHPQVNLSLEGFILDTYQE